MGECLICRGGRGQSDNIAIIPGYCQIIATVKDSDGIPIPDVYVTCNDGGTWYNYHTNENGKCLFVTNSGSVNIRAYNYSRKNNYMYIDQKSTSYMQIDAPVTTVNKINLQFSRFTNRDFSSSNMTINNVILSDSILFTGSVRFRVTNKIGEVVVGGAGGGGGGQGYDSDIGYGGGGGALNHGTDISVEKDKNYTFYLGNGGRCGHYSGEYYNASSGGSSSALGISAYGGSGATISGPGNGSIGNCGGGGDGVRNQSSDFFTNINLYSGSNGWGGGGGCYGSAPIYNEDWGNSNSWRYAPVMGRNGGGDGGHAYDGGARRATNGYSGGGGGGCYAGRISGVTDPSNYWYNGGYGSNGCIRFYNMT